jgi:hypothetical protein
MDSRPVLSQLAGGLVILAAACSGSPLGPSQLPAASSPLSQPPPPTSAVLVIEDFRVIVQPSSRDGRGVPVEGGWFALSVRFALRETGNRSGATVESFFLGDGVGGGDWYAGICTKGLHVPQGGVYDTLSTDEGHASWGYCAPHLGVVSVPIKEFPVFITVYFVDDDGRAGSTNAKAFWKP